MTNSIRKMLASKEAKRAHAVQVLYESIHIEPGFNLRLADDALEESIEALTLHILSGGKFPHWKFAYVMRAESGSLTAIVGMRQSVERWRAAQT